MAVPTVTTQTSNQISTDSVTSDKINDESIVNDHCHPTDGPSQWLVFDYQFGREGGATSPITLPDINGVAQTIPDKACVCRAYLEAIQSLTSGGSATVKLGVTGDDDALVAATAFDNAIFVAGAYTELDNTTFPYKVSTADAVIATPAVAALTAGKFRIHVEYREGK